MRDWFVTLLVAGVLPFCLIRPSIGVLAFSWLSYMNPHRLTWGFAYDLPFAQYVAIATVIGLVFSNETKRYPITPVVVIWLVLLAWMAFTTLFAFFPDEAYEGMIKVAKIQLMAFVTMMVMGTRERILALVWVIALSLAFYGVKGGIFGILTGGQYRVWGPQGSFIDDNNSLALALIMILPLLRFLQLRARKSGMQLALILAMLLTFAAILSTQSRGALVGVCAMAVFLWLKSKKKLTTGLALVLLAPAAFYLMPDTWHERMQTIQTYENDDSAMGRVTVWRYTYQLANHRLTGSGFRGIESDYGYKRYAPEIYAEVVSTHGNFRAAHSIWFGMLGQHGWPGLILFVLLAIFAWRSGSRVIRLVHDRPDLSWCGDLAAMLQVSMIGYAATGMFLSMEYFDLYYHIVALFVLLSEHVRTQAVLSAEPTEVNKLEVPQGQANTTPGSQAIAVGRYSYGVRHAREINPPSRGEI